MKLKQVLRSLASGSILYVAMAACGAADSAHAPSNDGGASDAFSISDAINDVVDELGNPVKDANAGPLPPLTADEPCDKDVTVGTTPSKAAIHAYPGKTSVDLAAISVLVSFPTTSVTAADGTAYNTFRISESFIRDGSVLVICAGATSAKFVLSQ